MPRLRRVAESLRGLLQRAGFDIVRFRALPEDLDPRIRETVRVVTPHTMTSPLRVAALCEAVRYISANRIPGAIVECGVWRGGSMMAVARTLLESGDRDRELYLFDTFEGMSEPSERDVAFTGETAQNLLSEAGDRTAADSVWCVASLTDVEQTMTQTGYEPARIHYVKGKVEDTIPDSAPLRIALLRLDTDWYESTKHEMQHLFPRLSPGGILILDDYGHWQGARQAVDEYIREAKAPLFLQRIDYSGRLAVKWA